MSRDGKSDPWHATLAEFNRVENLRKLLYVRYIQEREKLDAQVADLETSLRVIQMMAEEKTK